MFIDKGLYIKMKCDQSEMNDVPSEWLSRKNSYFKRKEIQVSSISSHNIYFSSDDKWSDKAPLKKDHRIYERISTYFIIMSSRSALLGLSVHGGIFE